MNKTRTVFVGQAPSQDTDGQAPFTGRSGRKLAALCGMSCAEFLDAFDLVNLLKRWPGKSGKGDAFPMTEARAAAVRLDLFDRPLVILVGKNVARAFGVSSATYFEVFLLGYVSAIGFTNVQFQNDWQSPDRPSHTILQGGSLGQGEGGPGYVEIKYIPAVVIPHPSGVNRWWNDPANTEQAQRFMRSLLAGPSTVRQHSSLS